MRVAIYKQDDTPQQAALKLYDAYLLTYHFGHEFGREARTFADQKVCIIPEAIMAHDPAVNR